jgi:Lipid A 3-O-deacylase (PagL)
LRKTPARQAAQKLIVALVFFLEGECAFAQAAPDEWRVAASYGQASAPRSQGFAEFGSLSIIRDFDLGANFTLGVELTPFFVVNLTRVDLPGRPREVAYAVAAAPLVGWTYLPKTASVGIRIEAGVALFWGFSQIPAEGSRFNFLDQFGGLILVRAGKNRLVSAGVRRVHVSNFGVVGPDNPGLSFYSGVVGLSWPAR